MLCYKNHRFYAHNASFKIPDGYFIDTEPGMEADECIHLWGPNGDYSVEVRMHTDSANAEASLESVLNGMRPTILKPVSPISINNMTGYEATYRHTRNQYYELWLDIDEGVTMCIVILTSKDILQVDSAAVTAAIDPQQ